jgi:preprotein translocase subunit YajC
VKRIVLTALFLAPAAIPFAATAQTAPAAGATATAGASVAAGATVYDTAGGVVGTVASTDGTNAVIDTGTVKAAVPVTSLGAGAKGPTLAMTKAQLDAAAGQQQAQASANFASKLVPGAAVYGTGGAQLGTIKSVDASGVTLTTSAGDAKLPTNGFGPGPQGVTIGMTQAQLTAAITAAGGGAAASSTTSATATTTGTAAANTTTTEKTTTSTPTADGTATTTTTTEKKTTTKRKPR